MDDNRLRTSPCAKQAIDILMMMKWIAATPVDQSSIRVVEIETVILERLTRIEQHISDARDRNKTFHWVEPDRQSRSRRSWAYISKPFHAAVAKTKTTAWEPDLA